MSDFAIEIQGSASVRADSTEKRASAGVAWVARTAQAMDSTCYIWGTSEGYISMTLALHYMLTGSF